MRLLALLFIAGAAHAADMTCSRAGTPVDLRAEGQAELAADAMLTCTGGVPAAPGAPLPVYEIVVSASAPFSTRLTPPQPPRT
ncbi:MAG: hypothetical protein M1541_20040, partial [Acidobacteria bacterium]|nr:hypothetical protein [Acidobacteriota bacterium]